jgi:hypothetical protein
LDGGEVGHVGGGEFDNDFVGGGVLFAEVGRIAEAEWGFGCRKLEGSREF